VPRVKELFSSLRRCKFWPQAEAQLRAGMSAAQAASYLQANGNYTHVPHGSLQRQIQRWMKQEGVRSKALMGYLIRATDAAAKERLGEVELMERLIAYQVQRLELDGKLEEAIRKAMPSQNKEVTTLADLLERTLRLKMEMGLIPRAPQQIESRSMHVHAEMDAKAQARAGLASLLGQQDVGALGQLVGAIYQSKRLPTKTVPSGPDLDEDDDG
jgi:hypothetical protein